MSFVNSIPKRFVWQNQVGLNSELYCFLMKTANPMQWLEKYSPNLDITYENSSQTQISSSCPSLFSLCAMAESYFIVYGTFLVWRPLVWVYNWWWRTDRRLYICMCFFYSILHLLCADVWRLYTVRRPDHPWWHGFSFGIIKETCLI